MRSTLFTPAPAVQTARPLFMLLCSGLALCLAAAPNPAQARSKSKDSSAASTGEPARKKGSVKIKHQRSSSEESSAERDRRLHRECKGRPNAGACLGYTQR